jgi:predicted hotdog family 3-hydroxylacyl-ACP dehydratase
MCLLERIVRWDATGIVLATSTHRHAGHPLATAGGLRAIHLCEYGAQAMAVHGGLSAAAEGRRALPGLLDTGTAWQYTFRVTHSGRLLAEGRAMVSAVRDGAG